MAARLNRRHQEMVREKIRASQLVNRLTKHAVGEIELSQTQIAAIRILLDKSIPNLSSVEMSGELETVQRVISAEPLTDAEWSKEYGGCLEATTGATESTH